MLVSKLKNNKAAEANTLLAKDFKYSFDEPGQSRLHLPYAI